jgi:hypothetical protein
MAIRLILADDYPLILDRLQNLFRLESEVQVIAPLYGRCGDS